MTNSLVPSSTRPRSSRGVVRGARMFYAMVLQLAASKEIDRYGHCSGSACQLYEGYRGGLAFRNIAADYMERARSGGPDAIAAFLACVGDCLASHVASEGDLEGYEPTAARIAYLQRALDGDVPSLEGDELAMQVTRDAAQSKPRPKLSLVDSVGPKPIEPPGENLHRHPGKIHNP